MTTVANLREVFEVIKNDPMRELIINMSAEIGRFPTEDEVFDFIMGDQTFRDEFITKNKKEF